MALVLLWLYSHEFGYLLSGKGSVMGNYILFHFLFLLSNEIGRQWEFYLSCIHKGCQYKNTCKNLCIISLFIIQNEDYNNYCYCYSTKLIFISCICHVQFFYYPCFYVYNIFKINMFLRRHILRMIMMSRVILWQYEPHYFKKQKY